MGHSRKLDVGDPIFPKGVPILPGKWGPQVPIFMGVPEVYSQSSHIAILSQMSHVLSDISCQIEWCLLHKECHDYS